MLQVGSTQPWQTQSSSLCSDHRGLFAAGLFLTVFLHLLVEQPERELEGDPGTRASSGSSEESSRKSGPISSTSRTGMSSPTTSISSSSSSSSDDCSSKYL
ncbi:hypothetical protein KUCAC02_009133 [Chaenocephalus aceratus]|uniref:Uncharacterized protein n=1 Tax=Chaenocephalus aceratus TaxID=36190 RepID=A0ACB9WU60_CHAAC|nr:hypothetical protein KUCAC02_009133 [Chaenocephalus aceratus]